MSTDSTNEPEHRNPWPIRAAIIGAIATLLASVGGLYFSADASRQATEQASQAREAQTSERFSRSVEQLGSDSIAVRIGAVYSFARLMRDSELDQRAITEILSTFVRVQAAQVPLPAGPGETRPAPADLLAALQVLNAFEERTHPDSGAILLSQVDLSKFDLHFVALSGADLSLADLTGADLYGANLSGANLTDAVLYGANLYGANLTGANLTGANLDSAYLTDIICSATTQWPAGFTPPPQCT